MCTMLPLLLGIELNVHLRADDEADPTPPADPFESDDVDEEADDELAATDELDGADVGEASDNDVDKNEASGLVGMAKPTP